jgi:uncharacterized membrane protein YcjF (UPF0283 family)
MHPSASGRELINVAVLGLILLAAAGVLTAAVVTSNTDSLAVDLWGVSVTNVTLGVVFVAGMITTVLAVVGLGLLMGGMRRSRRLRQERRALRRENEQLSQRVETTEPVTRHEDRVVRDDRAPVAPPPPAEHTQVMHDDRARSDVDARRTDRPPAPGATPTESGSSRSYLPQQEDRVHTESGPRNS